MRTARYRSRGGGGGGDALVAWGPDFGGEDGDQLAAQAVLDLDALALEGNLGVTERLTEVRVALVPGVRTPHDAWVPRATAAGNCIDNANKNGQSLRISAAAADNDAHAYIQYPTQTLPAGATLVSAELRLTQRVVGLADHTYTVWGIAAGSEGWTETGIVCSNAPAPVSPSQTFVQEGSLNGGGAGNLKVVDLTTAFKSYIEGRLGTNPATFVIADEEVAGQRTDYDDDEAGAGRPILALTLNLKLT